MSKRGSKNKFYIYFHINPMKNEIFYVGKGCGKRAYDKHSRSIFWHNTINKYGYIIDITETGLSNEEAMIREVFYIKKIGRRDLGLGPLVNMTFGGEGTIGKIWSAETRLKISLNQKGKKRGPSPLIGIKRGPSPLKGTKYSEESKSKMSLSKMGHISANKGKKFSDEVKLKMSIAAKNRKKK